MNNEAKTESVCKPNAEPVCEVNGHGDEAAKTAASLPTQAGRRVAKMTYSDGQPVLKPDAETVWKQLEDAVAPQLRLSLTDRVVYYHLLRHSRLEGKRRYRFSIASLGHGTRLSLRPAREAVRRLVHQGVLRLVRRNKKGHVVDVRVPEEIRGVRFAAAAASDNERLADEARLEEIDFMLTKELRQAIHAREGARCFYCLRRLAHAMRCLDHVVPRAQAGGNSYRNLVSACLECNVRKGEKPADGFLRRLYRDGRLTGEELSGRLRALESLAAGELRPEVKK
jgi:HNH endonuclease